MANMLIVFKVFCGRCGLEITDTVCQHAYADNNFDVHCVNCEAREKELEYQLKSLQDSTASTEGV